MLAPLPAIHLFSVLLWPGPLGQRQFFLIVLSWLDSDILLRQCQPAVCTQSLLYSSDIPHHCPIPMNLGADRATRTSRRRATEAPR